ncbi:thioredoxin family protein [Paenibacillus aestuarii]|uniref:Thioredoxin family protein n=1 Tax=Paenibacillus aestuarii TaxID=516965 RepID=A0ABW0K8L6_9BACL|nr:thioredoxin family protein [Paenibacillus aestuarii]
MAISQERREQAFRDAVSVPSFIEQAQVNQNTLQRNFAAFELSAEERSYFDNLQDPVDVLVLAHDWCGDVVANLPLFGRIAQDTGKLNVHVLPRDPHNTDIAAAYPYRDGKSHIPTYIFFDKNGEELGVFIERPDEITELLGEWKEAFWNEHPEWDGRGKAISALEDDVKKPLLSYLKEQRGEVREQEKTAIVNVLKQIIGEASR